MSAVPEDRAINAKLDRVASALIGAVAAVSAALALLGVNSDRVWVLLDDDAVRRLLLLAVGLAIVAVGLALAAYLLPAERNRLEATLLALGLAAYLVSLSTSLFVAAEAADASGRPSLTQVTMSGSPAERSVSFTVHAESLDPDQLLGVRVLALTSRTTLYRATVRPTPQGRAEQVVELDIGAWDGPLELAAWRLDDGEEPDCSQRRSVRVAGCAVISP